MSLPRKKQLALLGLCRVFDFLQIASLQAYMFYQLKSFDETLSDSDVSTQAGILQGAFTAAQFATAIPWGRVADAEWGGRRFVLLVGLVGTAVSCLGVAFATSFAQAVFWRSFGGAINGTVGIIRTMIAENVREKKYHSRAFLILPIGFNVAALFGPGKFTAPWHGAWFVRLTNGQLQSWAECSPTRSEPILLCSVPILRLGVRMGFNGL
jgi:MFS family permease